MISQDDNLERIYRSHGPAVLRRARQILGDEDQAHEVLQEIFLGLLDRPEQYAGRSAVMTFLYVVTTNLCLKRIRDSRNRARLLDERIAPAQITTVAPIADAVTDLRRLLERLPDEEAAVTVFYYLDGMSHAEIAAIQGCSRRQVGYLLERMHHRLQEEAR